MILHRLTVGAYESNCYIVGSESANEGVVIDPGDDGARIIKQIGDLKIKLIILTHGHIDHIAAVNKVRAATGAPVAIHPGDMGALKARIAVTPEEQSKIKLLQGGDVINFGDKQLTVLHTPGHSPGSICLLVDKVCFTGDTLFNFSIGRYDFPGGSGAQIMKSIHSKLMTLPDDTAIYPGHGTDSTIGNERRRNPFIVEGI